MAMPQHKNSCPGVMKFTILVDPSLIIINYNLSSSDLYLGVEQKVLKRNNAISLYDLFGHALAQNTLRRGHEFYNFTVSIVCLPDVPRLKKKYMANRAPFDHKNSLPWGNKTLIYLEPFCSLLLYTQFACILGPELRRILCFRIMHVHCIINKYNKTWPGVMKFTIP